MASTSAGNAYHETAIPEVPHNIEVEESLLGSILLDNDVLHDVTLIVKARKGHGKSA